MIWFILGATFAVAQAGWGLVRKPIWSEYATQVFGTAAILGAAVYGGILWVVAEMVLSVSTI
ncbi:hypothetical protein [Pseudaminobacter sp. NGMCC 1.201702]|uniref:hypothetical protein n=1 Tax=Pseudaminobacter sp. NGMCC 1.201702 TaxID=3391825 RepID=UPI0039F0547E